jgi:hypothetical protein
MREQKALIKILQYDFKDAATFECNILDPTIIITEEIEDYAHNILLLFLSYRCDNDLKKEGKYTYCLQDACNNNRLPSEYLTFLQNIQDAKSNSFRFKITNLDLDQVTGPSQQQNINENHSEMEVPQNISTTIDEEFDTFDYVDYLQQPMNDEYDDNNDDNIDDNLPHITTLCFNFLRQNGRKKCGYQCLPDFTSMIHMDP